jgi:hypothetical protein
LSKALYSLIAAFIHKYTCTSPDGQTHNETDNVLTDKRRHSSILGVRPFRRSDGHTDHCLVAAKVRKTLDVSKRTVNNMDMDRFSLKKLNVGKLRNSIRLQSKIIFSSGKLDGDH